jgi:tape measure domain-containing protein
MADDDGSLMFKIGLDAGQMKVQLQDANGQWQDFVARVQKGGTVVDSSVNTAGNSFKKLNDDINSQMAGINSTMSQFKGLVAGYFSVDAMKHFVDEVIHVRGEMESLQVTLETLTGSKAVGSNMFKQFEEYSYKTPLLVTDFANAAKTMLAYGMDTQQIMPTIKELGDVSMGNSEKLQSLAMSFGRVSSEGSMSARELREMIFAGFNPLKIISEQTGKSMADLKKEMASGGITAAQVADAFKVATSKGGQFYQMAEKQSKTVGGAMSNLKATIEANLNAIGTSNEGLIMNGIHDVSSLVSHYEQIGEVLAGLIATYGAYKAAVMVVTAVQSLATEGIGAMNMAMRIHYAWIVITEKAQSLLNKTMLANPYVLAATAITAMSAALIVSATDADKADSGIKAYKKEVEQATQAEQDHKEKINNLISVAEDEQSSTDDRRKALIRLETAYPGIFKKYKTEEDMLRNILKIKQEIAAEDDRRAGAKSRQDLSDINNKIKKERKAITDATLHGGGQGVLAMRNQLDSDLKKQALMQKGLSEKQRENVMSNLSGYSMTTLKKEYSARVRAGRRARNSQKLGGKIRSVRITNGIAPGWKSLDMNDEETQAIAREINSRGAGHPTYRSDSKKALIHWEKTKARLKKLQNSATATTKQVQDAMKDVQSASEDYKGITGITPENLAKKETSASKHAETERKRRQREAQTAHDKAAEQYNTTQQQTEQLRQQSAQTKQEMAQEEVGIQQNTVDVMKDGLQKELAQIDLNYNKSIEEIQKKRNDWVKELQKTMDLQFEKAHPNWKKQKLAHPVATYNDLSEEQKSILSTETEQAATTKSVGTANVYKNLLTQYANYEQQRENIRKKYAKDRESLNTATDENGNKLTAKALADYQAELDRQEKQAIKQVDDAEISQVYKDNNLFVKLFGDTSQESVAEIQKIIDKVRELLEYLQAPKDANGNGIIDAKKGKFITKDTITKDTGLSNETLTNLENDPEKLASIQKQLEQLLTTLQQNAPFEAFSSNILRAIEKIKKGGDVLDDKGNDTGISNISQGIIDIGDAIQKVTPSVSKLGNSLSQIFDKGSSKGGRMADQINTVVNILGSVGTSAKGVGEIMSGDVVDGIADTVNGIGNLFSMANSAAKRHKEALKAIMNEEIAQQREYNQLLVQQNLEYEQGTTAFGTDAYGKASNAVTEYGEVTKELKSAQSSLSSISIITGHKKTGLFGWGKGKDVYSSLLSQYPELIDSAGKFNDELAESIINTRKMSDEDKATLQNAIDLYKDQQDALTQMRDYLSSIFGDLGSTITDVLVSAFEHGTDAATKMTDSISDMLSKLAEQMVYDVTFEPFIETAQKQLESIMENTGLTDTDKFTKETQVLQTLFSSISGNEQKGLDLLAEVKKIGEEYGFDLFQDSSRSATTSSAVTASQDSVDEIAGRETAIQEYSKKSSDSLLLLVSVGNQALDHLAGIDKNTKSIDGRIYDMQKDITTMRKGIDRINDYGIDLKK